jgi:DNA-binding SARP family transcriptional activator
LAYLAYHSGIQHPREVLIELLWPDPGARAGRQSLSMALCSLRHLLESTATPRRSVIEADRFAVWLNKRNVTTDVQEFEAALASAREVQGARQRVRLLSRAIGLYRGEFLPGFYERWIPDQAVLLSEMFITALLDLASIHESMHAYGEAILLLRRVTAENPLWDEPYRRLMRIHDTLGQPMAGLQVYREHERMLAAEVGEDPSAATRALARAMKRLAKGGGVSPAGAPIGAGVPSENPVRRPKRPRCAPQ